MKNEQTVDEKWRIDFEKTENKKHVNEMRLKWRKTDVDKKNFLQTTKADWTLTKNENKKSFVDYDKSW